jgi:glycosyltransferase involved in cell wall biosynthesis
VSASFSVIIPTLGRSTLRAMLASIAGQDLGASDEVLVIGDGPQPAAELLARDLGPPFRYLEGPLEHAFGDPQREYGMARARGDYLLFADDDNAYLPGAFAAIRAAALVFADRPLIFRVRFLSGEIAPSAPRLNCGDFDTACGIWPNRSDRLSAWGHCYTGDYVFARQTLDLYPDRDRSAVWRSEIIAVHRPHLAPTDSMGANA